MIIKYKIRIIFIFLISLLFISNSNLKLVFADELQDKINEQLENIDLTELESYFNDIVGFQLNADFFSYINKIFNGEYNLEFDSFFAYITNLIKDNVKNIIPIFLEIIIIAIICGILQKLNSQIFSSGVNELILFVGLLGVILLLSGQVISIWKNVKIVIENIAKLTEIMSPIILTLMVSSGASVSASVYNGYMTIYRNQKDIKVAQSERNEAKRIIFHQKM